MKVLITGGCGFVGSNLAILLKAKYDDYQITCLDNLKRRGSELNIKRLKDSGINFIHGDVRNIEDFEYLPYADIVIDAAAEPSVLAGVNSSSAYCINSNLIGTINTLQFVIKCNAKLIFLSTSRVYSVAKLNQLPFHEIETRFSLLDSELSHGYSMYGINEEFSLDGFRSLYGFTKLSSELLIQEYVQLYNLNAVINRCGVITGPYQMGKVDQGFMVLWMSRHMWNQPLSFFGFGGQGKQVRDILNINDLFDLVDLQIHNIQFLDGEIYNIGGGLNSSLSLLELTRLCNTITGNKISINSVPDTNPLDVRIYYTQNNKIFNKTGWQPTTTIEDTILSIHEWLVKNEYTLKPILLN